MSAHEEYKRRHDERKREIMERLQSEETETNKGYAAPAPFYKPERKPDPPIPVRTPFRHLAVQILLSALLVAACYEVNISKDSSLRPVRQMISTAMTREFQFTAVSNWYEKNLGNPMSFLPDMSTGQAGTAANKKEQIPAASTTHKNFADPVTGEVTVPYTSKSKGVYVQTTANEAVKAVQDGLVIFVGQKKTTGQTIIIQHKDHDESWYGRLDKTSVKVYQEVSKGQKIGTTSSSRKGTFYFALKKGAKFIDPIQVMSFD